MPWTTESILAIVGKAALDECITEAHLTKATGLTATQVENSCDRLRRHGFLKRTSKGCHQLTPAGREAHEQGLSMRSGPKGPQQYGQRHRDPGMRQRAWNVLRMGKKVTYDDIVMRIVEGEERDAYGNVRKYVRALAQAGYCRPMPQREQPLNEMSNGCIRWMLVSDTGPQAPVVRVSRNVIYDPNLDAEIALVREIDEARA
ncbi:MAG: hypothetical protein Q7U97_03095 [Rhodocyclaceae bacterium]|nr:hypothetical protein [Rhodocyclaceae bacterium]